MPGKILYCTKHFQQIDVWYDCEECCQGAKEVALLYVRWLTKNQIKQLLKSSPIPPPSAGQIVQGTSSPRSPQGGS